MTLGRILAGTIIGLSLVACGDDGAGEGGGEPVAFHAESEPLPGFSFDTGMQPPASPAQVQLIATAQGLLSIDAVGESIGGKLTGKPGSGKMKLDMHVKLAGHLKVDSTFASYDGELPGVKDIDVAVGGELPFDPFLTAEGQSAEMISEIPETPLPDVPLGSVPGALKLTVAGGSVVRTGFHGTCARVANGSASYAGEAKVGGTIVLKGVIALDLPAPLNKEVALPDITIQLPEAPLALDLGTKGAPSFGESVEGVACGGGTGGPGTSDDGGPGSEDPDAGRGGESGTVTLKVDGVNMDVGELTLTSASRSYTLETTFRRDDAKGKLAIKAGNVGSGCYVSNTISLQPSGDIPFVTGESVACGLNITSVPTAVGRRLTGSFVGWVNTENETTPRTKELVVTFDVLRSK